MFPVMRGDWNAWHSPLNIERCRQAGRGEYLRNEISEVC
jgi:hypothetical protein